MWHMIAFAMLALACLIWYDHDLVGSNVFPMAAFMTPVFSDLDCNFCDANMELNVHKQKRLCLPKANAFFVAHYKLSIKKACKLGS
jgi:hypothetical protein